MQEHKSPIKNREDTVNVESKEKVSEQPQASFYDKTGGKAERGENSYNFFNKPNENFFRSLEVDKGHQSFAISNQHQKEKGYPIYFQSYKNKNDFFYETPDSAQSGNGVNKLYTMSESAYSNCSFSMPNMNYNTEALSSRDRYGAQEAAGFDNCYRYDNTCKEEKEAYKKSLDGNSSMLSKVNSAPNSQRYLDTSIRNNSEYFDSRYSSHYNLANGGYRNDMIQDRAEQAYGLGYHDCNYALSAEQPFPLSRRNEAYSINYSVNKSNGKDIATTGRETIISKMFNFNMKMLNKNYGPYSASESLMGCVHSEKECRILIEYAINGYIGMIRRRINEKEKCSIRPGSIFIFNESESGIKRWTDKKQWSPSRLQGPFLVYKELNGPLYKKTYTISYSDSIYHLISYSYLQWEEKGECCKIFKKIKNKQCNEKNDETKEGSSVEKKQNSFEDYFNRNDEEPCDLNPRYPEDSVIDEYKQLVKEKGQNSFYDIQQDQKSKIKDDSDNINEGMDKLDVYFNVNT